MDTKLNKDRIIPAALAAGIVLIVAGALLPKIGSEKIADVVVESKKRHQVLPSRKARSAQIALIDAAVRHEVSPKLLLAVVWFETIKTFHVKIRPRRKNGTPIGSAIGLCQFIKKTRILYGLPLKNDVMMRTSAVQQADACARLMADNIKVLKVSLGQEPEPYAVYLAHFLGVTKAVRFAKAKANVLTASLTTKKERKNNSLLKRKKTAGALRKWARAKMASGIKHVSIYVKRAPSVAGWRATVPDNVFFAEK
ncbi:MAG: hypothetical protein DSY80_07170 [Desulfocapsa sp.]|nr:MAG: hypothetical protein DSY80_07170 [Desulfocapsa sp.]